MSDFGQIGRHEAMRFAQPSSIVWDGIKDARQTVEAERRTLALRNAERAPGTTDDRAHDVVLGRTSVPTRAMVHGESR